MTFGNGEKGPEANIQTQLNHEVIKPPDALTNADEIREANEDLSEFDLDNIDVNAAAQAREGFDVGNEKPKLQDIGKQRAEALGKHLSSAKDSVKGFFGGLMKKLGYGALATPEAIGRATIATAQGIDKGISATAKPFIEGGKAVGQGFVAADQAIDRGLMAAGRGALKVGEVGLKAGAAVVGGAAYGVVEGAKGIGRGFVAADKGIDRAIDSTLRAGNEHIVKPVVENAKSLWSGFMEKGKSMINGLGERKRKAYENFLGWRASRLDKAADKHMEKMLQAEGASRERQAQLKELQSRGRAQAETLKVLETVQLDPETDSEENGQALAA